MLTGRPVTVHNNLSRTKLLHTVCCPAARAERNPEQHVVSKITLPLLATCCVHLLSAHAAVAEPSDKDGLISLPRDRIERVLSEEFQKRLANLNDEELFSLFEKVVLNRRLSAPDLLMQPLLEQSTSQQPPPKAPVRPPTTPEGKQALWPFKQDPKAPDALQGPAVDDEDTPSSTGAHDDQGSNLNPLRSPGMLEQTAPPVSIQQPPQQATTRPKPTDPQPPAARPPDTDADVLGEGDEDDTLKFFNPFQRPAPSPAPPPAEPAPPLPLPSPVPWPHLSLPQLPDLSLPKLPALPTFPSWTQQPQQEPDAVMDTMPTKAPAELPGASGAGPLAAVSGAPAAVATALRQAAGDAQQALLLWYAATVDEEALGGTLKGVFGAAVVALLVWLYLGLEPEDPSPSQEQPGNEGKAAGAATGAPADGAAPVPAATAARDSRTDAAASPAVASTAGPASGSAAGASGTVAAASPAVASSGGQTSASASELGREEEEDRGPFARLQEIVSWLFGPDPPAAQGAAGSSSPQQPESAGAGTTGGRLTAVVPEALATSDGPKAGAVAAGAKGTAGLREAAMASTSAGAAGAAAGTASTPLSKPGVDPSERRYRKLLDNGPPYEALPAATTLADPSLLGRVAAAAAAGRYGDADGAYLGAPAPTYLGLGQGPVEAPWGEPSGVAAVYGVRYAVPPRTAPPESVGGEAAEAPAAGGRKILWERGGDDLAGVSDAPGGGQGVILWERAEGDGAEAAAVPGQRVILWEREELDTPVAAAPVPGQRVILWERDEDDVAATGAAAVPASRGILWERQEDTPADPTPGPSPRILWERQEEVAGNGAAMQESAPRLLWGGAGVDAAAAGASSGASAPPGTSQSQASSGMLQERRQEAGRARAAAEAGAREQWSQALEAALGDRPSSTIGTAAAAPAAATRVPRGRLRRLLLDNVDLVGDGGAVSWGALKAGQGSRVGAGTRSGGGAVGGVPPDPWGSRRPPLVPMSRADLEVARRLQGDVERLAEGVDLTVSPWDLPGQARA